MSSSTLSPNKHTAESKGDASTTDTAVMELMRPGPEHAQLARFVGSWDVDFTHWMKEGEPAKRAKATAVVEPVYDGRYVCEEFSSEFEGRPFSGTGTTGFDRVAKQFVTTWYDNMGTGIARLTATPASDDQELIYHGTMMCPEQGEVELRHVVSWESGDRFTLTMFNSKDGQERKVMELVYTRQ